MENGKTMVCFACWDGLCMSQLFKEEFAEYISERGIEDITLAHIGLQNASNYTENIKKVDILVSIIGPSEKINQKIKKLELRDDALCFYFFNLYNEHGHSKKAILEYLVQQVQQEGFHCVHKRDYHKNSGVVTI